MEERHNPRFVADKKRIFHFAADILPPCPEGLRAVERETNTETRVYE